MARFVFGDRKGPQRKTMEVRTDDDSAAAKTIQLTAEAGQPVRIKRIIASNPRLAAKLETVKAGEHYTVAVTPTDTTQKESGEVFVLTDFPADAPRTYILQVRVK